MGITKLAQRRLEPIPKSATKHDRDNDNAHEREHHACDQ
jgi:hypothetical protein